MFRWLLMCCIGTALFAAAQKKSILQKWIIDGYAQGTTYQVTYYATDSIVVQSQIDSLLNKLDTAVSLYNPSSIICAFNKSNRGLIIDDHFKTIIQKAININHVTNGLVDITVKPLVDAWGFGKDKPTALPTPIEVKKIVSYVGTEKIYLKGNWLGKKNASVQIDLNGIAQGYAVDLMADLLEHNGINNYIVELGGELRLKGTKQPGGASFSIGIQSATDENEMSAVIYPADGALTTSGNYRKYIMNGKRKLAHIIDPKSGYPVNNEMISVTVWAKNAITADGYDNGFMAMGLKQSLRFLQNRHDMGAYIIYQKKDGTIADTVTFGFKTHLKNKEK